MSESKLYKVLYVEKFYALDRSRIHKGSGYEFQDMFVKSVDLHVVDKSGCSGTLHFKRSVCVNVGDEIVVSPTSSGDFAIVTNLTRSRAIEEFVKGK